MTFLYLDASAWVKRYYRERGSDHIHELLSGEDPRACSVLGLVEVIATLARKCKAQEITREDFDLKMAEIERDWQSFILGLIQRAERQLDLRADVATSANESSSDNATGLPCLKSEVALTGGLWRAPPPNTFGTAQSLGAGSSS